MIYDNPNTELNQLLRNPLYFYEGLAAGKKLDSWGRPAFKPSVEQRADAIAEEQRKYLATPVNRNGDKVGISDAVFQFQRDAEAYRVRKDKALGELAALGRADVLQENLADLLKIVKKLSPTQKARRDAGMKGDYYDPIFNNIKLHFMRRAGSKFGMLVIEMCILDESGGFARIGLSKVITVKLYTASFTVRVDWNTLYEIVKTYDKERLSIQYRDWTDRFVIQQRRNTTRLIAHPPFNDF